MVLGAMLNPINSSMIAVALIPIGLALHEPPARTAWLVSSLYLATAVGQPVAGRLVDLLGPRPVFLVGTTLVGIGGALGMLAQSLDVLVLARVLIGLGTCAGYPAAMFLLRSESRRTGVDNPTVILTLLTFSAQTISVIGPTLGGLLIDFGGWRSVLSVNLPLSAAAFLLGARRFPKQVELPPRAGGARLDVPGVALFTAALLTLMVLLMNPDRGRLWLLPVGVIAWLLLAGRELRSPDPFIDLRVLAGNGPLVATYIRQLLASTVSYAFLYGYTQWLEAGRGLNASQTGALMVPMFLTSMLVTAVTGRSKAVRLKLLGGGAMQFVAAAVLSRLSPSSPFTLLVPLGLIVGVPQGVLGLANQTALYYQADPARVGASSGLLRTFMYLGAIVAAAANAAAFAHGVSSAGLHDLAYFLMLVAVVFIALSASDHSLRAIIDGRHAGPGQVREV